MSAPSTQLNPLLSPFLEAASQLQLDLPPIIEDLDPKGQLPKTSQDWSIYYVYNQIAALCESFANRTYLKSAFAITISQKLLYSSEGLAPRVNRLLFTGALIPRVFVHISSDPPSLENGFKQEFENFLPPLLAFRLRLINVRISMVNLSFAIYWYNTQRMTPERTEALSSLAQEKLEQYTQKCAELEREIAILHSFEEPN